MIFLRFPVARNGTSKMFMAWVWAFAGPGGRWPVAGLLQ